MYEKLPLLLPSLKELSTNEEKFVTFCLDFEMFTSECERQYSLFQAVCAETVDASLECFENATSFSEIVKNCRSKIDHEQGWRTPIIESELGKNS